MPKRVLIAEDVKPIRMVLKRMLQKLSQDWIIDEAVDGEEAIDRYFYQQPQVVLLDVQLPKINGWDILRCIREVDKRTTIIMVTADESPESVLHALEQGASGFVGKPFDQNELTEALMGEC